ncbi:MAG: diaminopimelate epimerase [Deltaproteobacteria bacterium]|nr:diaminopimelate epimerase [Deltaproteobacteria bacterium]HDZ89831.1 diaminopimelate epimerase [Deltaproteobacteria bacterium]
MKPVEFWKMSGSGNDFILIDNRDGGVPEGEMGRLVERACRRRESVGADGVIFVVESARYDFGWRFFNADGGEVEMCGNGGRCVSRFAFLKGIAGPEMTFETLAGPISARVDGRVVKVLMPNPGTAQLDVDLEFRKGWRSCDFINTGVPHVVVHVEDLQSHPVREEGSLIRFHERFSPEGTNANFVTRTGPRSLVVRTYERGVEDETLACGTGAIASALVSSMRGMVDSPVRVKTWGGEELIIYFQREDHSFSEVWLEGNTSIIYEGRLHREAL